MRLYHFTAGPRLRGIAQHGLTVGDVPTDIARNEGRIGVWFTSSQSPDGHGLGGSALEKARFRLTVDVPENANLHRWTGWAEQNVTMQTRVGLRGADGDADASWYVYFGWIAPERIVQVHDMKDGAIVANWDTVWPEDQSLRGVSYESRFKWQDRMLRDVKRALKEGARGFRR